MVEGKSITSYSNGGLGFGVKKVFGISRGSPSSLDIYCQNSTLHSNWSKSQRRAYQRINSGLKRHQGERLRFMTLTTPEEPKRGLSEAFGVLKPRIKRISIKKLEDGGYLKRGEVRKYYGGRYKVGLDFEYLKVETSEGASGVYHIMYFGDYIPQAWLSDQWGDIIGAKVVDIRATKRGVGNTRKLARYCIAQYCAGQKRFLRYSWSWKWVFKGFVRVWKWVIKSVGVRKGIELWGRIMSGERLIFERDGVAYSVGMDPPHVRSCANGRWVDVFGTNSVKVCCGGYRVG